MKPATAISPRAVSAWRAHLAAPDAVLRRTLCEVYGADSALQEARIRLLQRTLAAFQDRFGDLSVEIHRAPGRINLRGMHVDTHGGWLNLATHQREVIVVSAAGAQGSLIAANVDPAHAEVCAALDATHAGRAAGWENYIRGVARRAGEDPRCAAGAGMRCMVGSDLPTGASLSSSAALCIALLDALACWNGVARDDATRILAARDAEWYAGARTGTGDQAAIVLGRRGMLTHASLMVEDFSLDTVRHVPVPDSVAVLVIDSLTSRQLSGAARVDYARNRFAYSMALHILRRELVASGWPHADATALDRLSRATPEALGGNAAVYTLLRRIPERLSLDAIQSRYDPPALDAQYAQYFGELPEAQRPADFALRGPLLFALAESERARRFPEALAAGTAGPLLCTGHDGDRVVDAAGRPFARAADDAALRAWERAAQPLAACPGDYGASTPALDYLVDAACEAGAWGATLTGAGMGGAVVALCAAAHAETIADAIRVKMRSTAYAARSGVNLSPDDPRLAAAVMVNVAVAGAGALQI